MGVFLTGLGLISGLGIIGEATGMVPNPVGKMYGGAIKTLKEGAIKFPLVGKGIEGIGKAIDSFPLIRFIHNKTTEMRQEAKLLPLQTMKLQIMEGLVKMVEKLLKAFNDFTEQAKKGKFNERSAVRPVDKDMHGGMAGTFSLPDKAAKAPGAVKGLPVAVKGPEDLGKIVGSGIQLPVKDPFSIVSGASGVMQQQQQKDNSR